jgi:hypothetical protein
MRQRATRLSAIGGVSRRSLGPTFVLDQLSAPSAAAYSLRKLRAAHMGSADRVRRSSDNAEANIGFATAVQTRTNLTAIPINNNAGATAAGVTMTTVGTGTEFGQPYIDVRWQGTSTGVGFLQFVHDGSGAITPGLTYTTSIGFRLVSGTAPSGVPTIRALYYTSSGFLSGPGRPLPPLTAALQRGAFIGAAPANAVFTRPSILMPVNDGEVVNATIRYYAANVEQGTGNARPLLQRNVPEVVADIGDYDAEAVLSFVGGGDGFETTRYDQSGNGRNATQTTPGAQTRIVSNGAIETQNGRATVVQTATDQSLLISSAFSGFTSATGVFVFRQLVNSGVGAGAHGFRRNGGNDGQNNHSPASGTTALDGFFSADRMSFANYGPSTTLTTHTVRQTGAALQLFKNGTQIDGDKTVAFLTYGAEKAFLMDANTNGTVALSEGIIFGTALSTDNRQILERNQGQYYSISVA